jgi:hypothetical protein
VSIGGLEDSIGGDSSLFAAPSHPADNNPVDLQLTIGEMTAYGAAWKRGHPWPNGPTLALDDYRDYVLRAVVLWQGGESYRYDSNVLNPPLWWVNTAASPATNGVATNWTVVLPTAGDNAASVQLPNRYQAGQPLPITLAITPATNVVVYAVEHQLPLGWLATNVSVPGFYDGTTRKVKWGPFFDDTPRIFSYAAVAPAQASGLAFFAGAASFDGTNVTMVGQRQTSDSPGAIRLDAPLFQTNQGFQLTLTGEGGYYYAVQASTNLLDWVALTNLIGVGGGMPVFDPAATNFVQRFYRVFLP